MPSDPEERPTFWRNLLRQRVVAGLALEPSLKVILEHLEVEGDAGDGNGRGADRIFTVGAAAMKGDAQDASILVERDGVRIEVFGLRRKFVKPGRPLVIALRLLEAACREFFLRLIGSLFHHDSSSAGCVDRSSEDRVTSESQDPSGALSAQSTRRNAAAA